MNAGRIADASRVGGDTHGKSCCPHVCVGPATGGSSNVLINGKGALRIGDRGQHAACCGEGSWEAVAGAPGVLINGRRAHRRDDETRHCGGTGHLVGGSPDVIVGQKRGPAFRRAMQRRESYVLVRLVDANGQPLAGVECDVALADGTIVRRQTDPRGEIRLDGIPRGTCRVILPKDGGATITKLASTGPSGS